MTRFALLVLLAGCGDKSGGATDDTGADSGSAGGGGTDGLLPCPETLSEIPRREFRVGGAATSGQSLGTARDGGGGLLATSGDTTFVGWWEQSLYDEANPAQLDLAVARWDSATQSFDPPVEIDVGDRRVEEFRLAPLSGDRVLAVWQGPGPVYDAYEPECEPENNRTKGLWSTIYTPGSGWSEPVRMPFEGRLISVSGGTDYRAFDMGLEALTTTEDRAAATFRTQGGGAYVVRMAPDGTWSEPVQLDDGVAEYEEVSSVGITSDGVAWVVGSGRAWRVDRDRTTTSYGLPPLVGDQKHDIVRIPGEGFWVIGLEEPGTALSIPLTGTGPGAETAISDQSVEEWDSPGHLATAINADGVVFASWERRANGGDEQGVWTWYEDGAWAPVQVYLPDDNNADIVKVVPLPDGRFHMLAGARDRDGGSTSWVFDTATGTATGPTEAVGGAAGDEGADVTAASDGTVLHVVSTDRAVVVGY